MIGQDRDDIRRFFVSAWLKQRNSDVLSPLEHVVTTVIGQHPEYHALLTDEQTAIAAEPGPDGTNPFFHMGMHIAMQEQLGADHPAGIRELHRRIVLRAGDVHAAEHQMMDCLGQVLHDAQGANTPPDEARYLDCLKRLASA